MIKSMTAFSRQHAEGSWGNATIEIKTVNHRYLDVNLRLPDMLRELEMPLRDLFRKQLSRGKLDCSVRYTMDAGADAEISLNQTLLTQLINATSQVEAQLTNPTAYNALELLRWPGVMLVAETDLNATKAALLELAKQAINDLNDVRLREGSALTQCVIERLESIEQQVALVTPRVKHVVIEQQQKLQYKIAELALTLDPERMEQEIALLAQRVDIAEELDRLQTHVKEVRRVLKKGGIVGRRLDFLMQELNREANTLASKSIDTQMTQAAVEIKVLIEQMREQIQNIE